MTSSFQSTRFAVAALATLILALLAKFTFTSLALNFSAEWLAALFALAAGITAAVISSFHSDNDTAEQVPSRTLYVGNLPYRANEAAVRKLFSSHGHVLSVRLMKDRNTGKRRGFGFVEMAANDAVSAITALNESEYQERTLKVREAKEKANA